jgi:hypothetical protein
MGDAQQPVVMTSFLSKLFSMADGFVSPNVHISPSIPSSPPHRPYVQCIAPPDVKTEGVQGFLVAHIVPVLQKTQTQ